MTIRTFLMPCLLLVSAAYGTGRTTAEWHPVQGAADHILTWRSASGRMPLEDGSSVSWSVRLPPVVKWIHETKNLRRGEVVQSLHIFAQTTDSKGRLTSSLSTILHEPLGSRDAFAAKFSHDPHYLAADVSEESSQWLIHWHFEPAESVPDWANVTSSEEVVATIRLEHRDA